MLDAFLSLHRLAAVARQRDLNEEVSGSLTNGSIVSPSSSRWSPAEDSEGEGSIPGSKSAKARWAVSKQAKLILEQVYQMERFPSAEMRRRLADDFKVEARQVSGGCGTARGMQSEQLRARGPAYSARLSVSSLYLSQVQFWYQNRRQRDTRALKAAKNMDGSSDVLEGTSHAEAILQQLRTLNEARRTLGIHQQPCVRAPRPGSAPLAGYPMAPTAYSASTAAAMGLVPLASMPAAQMAAGAPPPYLCYPAMARMEHPSAYTFPEQHQMLPVAGHPVPARALMPQQAMMPQQPSMAGYGHMGHMALQMALGPYAHQAHLPQFPITACNPHMQPRMQHMPGHLEFGLNSDNTTCAS